MVKKAFKHKEIEPCKLCKLDIDTTKERYAVMIDYEGKEHYSIGFYHLNCLKERIQHGEHKKTKELMNDVMGWGENLISNIIGKPKEEVYVIN